jgi:hypothetical protein
MEYNPVDYKEDQDKFFNKAKKFPRIFNICDHCNRGEVKLLVTKQPCHMCEGRGFTMFNDFSEQNSSIHDFNDLWETHHDSSPVTDIVKVADTKRVVSASYLHLKNEHTDVDLVTPITKPRGYKEVVSSTIVLEEDDQLVEEYDLADLIFCLVYYVEERKHE